jgi:hypothetical protein
MSDLGLYSYAFLSTVWRSSASHFLSACPKILNEFQINLEPLVYTITFRFNLILARTGPL